MKSYTVETLKIINDISTKLFSSIVSEKQNVFTKDEIKAINIVVCDLYPNSLDINKTVVGNWNDLKEQCETKTLDLNMLLNYMFPNDLSLEIDERVLNYTLEEQNVSLSNITLEEFDNKLRSLLLSNNGVDSSLVGYIVEYILTNDKLIDVNDILVKEIKYTVMGRLSLLPTDPNELLVYIAYVTTERAMLVQDSVTLQSITNGASSVIYILLNYTKANKDGMAKLASIFYRHKKIFLAIKSGLNKESFLTERRFINVLRRKASKYHKPIVESPYKRMLSEPMKANDLMKMVSELDTPYLIKVLNGVMYRLEAIKLGVREARYKIRNGVSYISTFSTRLNSAQYSVIEMVIVNELNYRFDNSIKDNNIVFINSSETSIELGLPINGKQMVGNLPYGTKITYPNNSDVMFGIYWTEEGKVIKCSIDLDLSVVNKDSKIGWDSSYASDNFDIMYSGDVIEAPTGASEVIYIKELPIGVSYDILVSNFSETPVVDYTLSLANTEVNRDVFNKDYCMDVNEIFHSSNLKFDIGVTTMKLGRVSNINGKTSLTIVGGGERRNVSKVMSDIANVISGIEVSTYVTLGDIIHVDIQSEDIDETATIIDVANPDISNLMLLIK